MKREVHILSYFSLETDLASEMQEWPEFVSGSGYSVDLRCPTTGELVSVRLIPTDEEPDYVAVNSPGAGGLFDRVLGRVVYRLSCHSDNLMIDRVV